MEQRVHDKLVCVFPYRFANFEFLEGLWDLKITVIQETIGAALVPSFGGQRICKLMESNADSSSVGRFQYAYKTLAGLSCHVDWLESERNSELHGFSGVLGLHPVRELQNEVGLLLMILWV